MEIATSMMPAPFVPISQLMNANRATQHSTDFPVAYDGFNQQGQVISWQQFQQDTHQLSQLLRARSESRWAICFDDSYWFSVAFMAACHSQKQLIIPGNLQPAALAELSQHFDAVLHDRVIDFTALTPHFSVDVPRVLDKKIEMDLPQFENLTDVAITLFTSGSSGQPKAIEKPLSILEKEVAQLQATWGESLQGATTASTVSHQHIYGLLFRILWPLSASRPFLTQNWQYPEQIIEHAAHNLVLISSPALLKRLTPTETSDRYRAIFSSGGPLPLDSAKTCNALFYNYPHEVLGSTETGGIAHRQQYSSDTPWQAFVGTQIDVNVEQCLKIKSPLVDMENWYQTADQCELLDNQHFMLKGRADRLIKIEEKRISLSEIERRLNQLDEIDEAAVILYQEPKRLITAAAITLSPIGQAKLNQLGKGKFVLMLRQSLHQWIEPVAIPRRFRVVDEIPLNTQGKRLISDIEQLFHSESRSK
ncbi:AMP-binding protein [Vibrio algivorus]|nr:AMP-binding protein [Vibrio algivorus]